MHKIPMATRAWWLPLCPRRLDSLSRSLDVSAIAFQSDRHRLHVLFSAACEL